MMATPWARRQLLGDSKDIEVINKHMVTALPEQYRSIAAVGTDRLLEFKDELEQVRSELSGREPSQTSRAQSSGTFASVALGN